jgi:ABC-type glutathione transport system ATPase component
MSRDPPLYFTSLLSACYMRPKRMKPQDQAMDLGVPSGAGAFERADPAIEVEALTKHFKGLIAVDRVSFSVARGSVTGFLGGNGAGKSTTIGMVMGLILPTSGEVRVLGVDMLRDRRRVLARMNFESPTSTCRIA